MNQREWQEPEDVNKGKRFEYLLKKTELVFEHPEWYEGACLCKLCCSYGD